MEQTVVDVAGVFDAARPQAHERARAHALRLRGGGGRVLRVQAAARVALAALAGAERRREVLHAVGAGSPGHKVELGNDHHHTSSSVGRYVLRHYVCRCAVSTRELIEFTDTQVSKVRMTFGFEIDHARNLRISHSLMVLATDGSGQLRLSTKLKSTRLQPAQSLELTSWARAGPAARAARRRARAARARSSAGRTAPPRAA